MVTGPKRLQELPPSVLRSIQADQLWGLSVELPATMSPLANTMGLSLMGPSKPGGRDSETLQVRPSSSENLRAPVQVSGEEPTL